MGIDKKIKAEITFHKEVKGKHKIDLKKLSKKSGVSYSNMRKYVAEEDRSMSGKNLDSVAEALGYDIALIKKDK